MDLVQEFKKALAYRRKFLATVDSAMEQATNAAIDATAKATPPLSEPNTTTGELKDHWATDSEVKAVRTKDGWQTTLANNKQYASYVNDGHRMDQHYVPGLMKTEFGLEYFPALRDKVGIMVGTQTEYVPGVHMVEKGQEAFEQAIEDALQNIEEGL